MVMLQNRASFLHGGSSSSTRQCCTPTRGKLTEIVALYDIMVDFNVVVCWHAYTPRGHHRVLSDNKCNVQLWTGMYVVKYGYLCFLINLLLSVCRVRG